MASTGGQLDTGRGNKSTQNDVRSIFCNLFLVCPVYFLKEEFIPIQCNTMFSSAGVDLDRYKTLFLFSLLLQFTEFVAC